MGTWLIHTYHAISKWQWSAISLSLITASVFWIFHQLNQDHSANLVFPISIEFDRKDVVIVKRPPSTVLLNVTGYGWVLLSKSFGFNKEEVKIQLDEPLKQKVLTQEEIRLAAAANIKSNIQVNQVVKPLISFDYDTMARKKVVVTLDRKAISTAPGHWVSSNIHISPSRVWVSGTAQRLAALSDTLHLIFRQKSPLKGPYRGKLMIDAPTDRFISLDQKTVKVHFDVVSYKQFEAIAKLKLKNFPKSGYRITPDFGLYQFYTNVDAQISFIDTLTLELDYDKMLSDSTIIPNEDDPVNLPNYSIVPKYFKIEAD